VDDQPIYRSEVPLLVALPSQVRQVDLAMVGNLHRRMGDEVPSGSRSTMRVSDDAVDLRESWIRAVYTDMNLSQSGPGQAQSDGHVAGLQVGTDLWANANWHTGIYVGYLGGDIDVSGDASARNGRVGSNDLSSNYLGAYATWRDNQGWYVDSVLQSGRHHYDINPDTSPSQSGKATSYVASVETGKAYPLNDQWVIEPQVQLIFQHSDFDDETLSGARVEQDAGNGWIGRVGVRIKGDVIVDKVGHVQPYARLNVYRAHLDDDEATFVGPGGSAVLSNDGGYTSGEVAAGGTVALTSSMDLYGEVGHMWDISGDTRVEADVQASLGLKVRW
jgi:outer membrane autotransporter protein